MSENPDLEVNYSTIAKVYTSTLFGPPFADIKTAFEQAAKTADWSDEMSTKQAIEEGIAPGDLIKHHYEGVDYIDMVLRVNRDSFYLSLSIGMFNTSLKFAHINYKDFLPKR